jgi:DNA-binding transcriptional regulator YhcF (GntR family)
MTPIGVKEMEQSQKKRISDRNVRHFIYATFAQTSRPPSTLETAAHFKISIAAVEKAYERLADAHHIALAPGTHSIWMAHPFSSLPTNFVAEVESKRFWGN